MPLLWEGENGAMRREGKRGAITVILRHSMVYENNPVVLGILIMLDEE